MRHRTAATLGSSAMTGATSVSSFDGDSNSDVDVDLDFHVFLGGGVHNRYLLLVHVLR